MKSIFLFSSLFLFSFVGLAQDYELKGTVTSGDTPLSGAIVAIEGSDLFTQTDEDGEYVLQLDPGVYNIVFSHGNRKKVRINLQKDMVLNVDLGDAPEVLDEVFLSAVRVTAESPITYSNLDDEEIADRNLGQDIPKLMQYMPAVTTTSDAGAGIGYSSIRVRGTAARGINVTINGVPYNDAESQGTFWVNLGDFASSVESLQLQRGVGTSTNGAGAFGASINILTDRYQIEPSATIANSFGSYNTRKHTASFSTGLFEDHWEFSGRFSVIKSDGYIDRASADLKSYFIQGNYVDGGTLIKALTFGGSEVTYQAWDGIDAATLATDRTFNPAGAYEDEEGNMLFYENHVDDYKQDHFQLLWNQEYRGGWASNLALHYTYGRGFYESYRAGEDLEAYGLEPFSVNGELVTESDLVTRKWLVNDFYGTTFNVEYEEDGLEVIIGGAWNMYEGDHFGEIVYTRFAPSERPLQHYYDNKSQKSDFNIFGKTTVSISKRLSLFADLQLRTINYSVNGVEEEFVPFIVDDSFNFFNPKTGFTYAFSEASQLYFSYAKAQREPNRADYEAGNPEPETLEDYELGWRLKEEGLRLSTNLYYMDYKNQLVLTGELSDVGVPIRRNSGNSYRLGLEINARVRISDKLSWAPNLALSRNKNEDWVAKWDGELKHFGATDISFSPELIAGNIITYLPEPNLELSLLSKYVGSQYMSNLENEGSKLESYFINDFNIQYTWADAPLFEEIILTGLVNNIFGEEYVSNGYYYTYDVVNESFPGGVETIGGAGYYPQATRNWLAGITLKF